MARSTDSVEAKRCSKLLPFFKFLIRTWTKARRFPGVRCVTDMMEQTSLFSSTHIPARKALACIRRTPQVR